MGTHLRLEFFSKSAEEFQNESLKNMMQEVVMENISEILQVTMTLSKVKGWMFVAICKMYRSLLIEKLCIKL